MSTWTRPRIPHVFAIVQLLLRVGALGTAIAELVILARLARKYPDANNRHGKTFGGAIATSTIAIGVQLLESIPLADGTHKIKRPATGFVILADLVILGIGIYSILEIALSDLNLADAPTGTTAPWASLQQLALVLMIAIVAETVAALLLGCVTGCRQLRASNGQRPSAAKMSRLPRSEQRSREPAG